MEKEYVHLSDKQTALLHGRPQDAAHDLFTDRVQCLQGSDLTVREETSTYSIILRLGEGLEFLVVVDPLEIVDAGTFDSDHSEVDVPLKGVLEIDLSAIPRRMLASANGNTGGYRKAAEQLFKEHVRLFFNADFTIAREKGRHTADRPLSVSIRLGEGLNLHATIDPTWIMDAEVHSTSSSKVVRLECECELRIDISSNQRRWTKMVEQTQQAA